MNTLLTIFGAYPPDILRAAFKTWALSQKEKRIGLGWKLHSGGTTPAGHEWMEIAGKKYIRAIPNYDKLMEQIQGSTVASTQHSQDRVVGSAPNSMKCPICGEDCFPQPVCAKCEKGKSGIKTQWICGNDPDHFFYTEF